MPTRKQTREELLERCLKAHNGKYSYEKTSFGDVKFKTTITCPIHGDFEQKLVKHYSGQGCPICASRGYDDSIKNQSDVNAFWINKFRVVHGDKYVYDKMNYNVSTSKIIITCPIHGNFEQTPGQHLSGRGCPKCKFETIKNKLRTPINEVLAKFHAVHGDKYVYDLTGYTDLKSVIKIQCPEHGWFNQSCQNHLNGNGCPECGKVNSTSKRKLQRDILISKFKQVHGEVYDYSKMIYEYKKKPVIITCPVHGDFTQTPENHLTGSGCPKCAIIKNAEKRKYTFDDFMKLSRERHGDKYEYHEEDFKSYTRDKTRITCDTHGDFWMLPINHVNGQECPKCHGNVSKVENELFEVVKVIFPDAVQSDKTVLLGKELDILVPSINLAIEFDGLYWHNELNVGMNYHLEKTIECEKRGLRLFHVFEDEWLNKRELIVSMLRYIAGKDIKKVMARKCEVIVIDNNTARDFYDHNHLQGHVVSNVHLALVINGEILCVESFSCKKDKNDVLVWYLTRFANKIGISVTGGASKLLRHFEKHYNPSILVSYVDRRWSTGNLYNVLGFKLKHVTPPSYYLVVNGERRHRFAFRKEVLMEKYGCPAWQSEHEFCLEQRWYRIYNCGVMVMEKTY